MLVDFFWDVGHFKVFICNNIASVLYFGVFGLDARRILAPPRGIEPVPPALEGEVLATGPPGKSLKCFFLLSLKSLMTKQQGQNHFHFYCHALSTELPTWHSGKESVCNARDLGSIPGEGRSPGEGNGNPLHYSWLENSTDRGAWRAAVHGVAETDTTE